MSKRRFVFGTRGSALALWQTQFVIERLLALTPDLHIEVKTIKTRGDLVRDRALSQVGGKGLFVKEIETALLAGEIDLAVHSLKDMPTMLPEGLTLGALVERASPHDALIARIRETTLASLPPGARVGTSSLRRRAQLLAARPDLQVLDLRGNVETRLGKLQAGEYDAVVLAASGLIRLGYGDVISEILPFEVMLPAVGQGALAVESRADDDATRELIAPLDHHPTRQATEAERAFLQCLEGGCQAPIGAYAEVRDSQFHLRGLIASLDGTCVVRDEIHGPATEAARWGIELANRMLASGGGVVLEEIRHGLGS